MGWLSGWATLALLLTGAANALPAQEPELTWVPQEKARIGVLLEEVCELTSSPQTVCGRPPIVTSVVVNGPADRAGVKARDTLLAVNGLDATSEAGRALLLGLESGVPVKLEVGREGGRATIEVTPETRPSEPYVEVRTMHFGPPDAITEGARRRVQVMRVPSVRRRLDEVEVSLDSMRVRGNDFVFFEEDTDGTLKVEVGNSEKAHVMLERIREHQVGPGSGVSVWENEDLARRLVVVRDSSLRSARVHLDSLVRLRGQFQALGADSFKVTMSLPSGTDPGGEWAYYVRPRVVPEELRALFVSDVRVGGAEFRPLTGDLAEYFDGADEGLLVLRVLSDTPAHRMGLKAGDVVTEVDGLKCNNIMILREAIGSAGPHGSVEVKWVRKGQPHVGRLDAR